VILRLWLIRHALVAPEALTYLYGTQDVAVCAVTMAADTHRYAALAARLPKAARLIVTPLSRTQLTAEAIFAAGYGERAWEVDKAFIEQDFGDWQGQPMQQLNDRPAFNRHPFWPIAASETPPGGESFADMILRVGAGIDRLAAGGDDDIVVISHGGAIRAAVAHALGLTPHQALSMSVDNISLTRLEHNGSDWRLISLNEQLSG